MNVAFHWVRYKEQASFHACLLFAVCGTCGRAPGTQSIDDSVLSSAAAQTRCAAFPFLLGLEYAWDVCEPLTAGCCSLPCWSSALHAAGLLLAPSQGELGRPFIYCSLGGTWRPITEVPGHATSPSQQPVCILSCQESYRTYTSKE